MKKPIISIITPTTGKDSLFTLIESITKQGFPVEHIILWDDKKEGRFSTSFKQNSMKPSDLDKEEYWNSHNYLAQIINMKGLRNNGEAKGSTLRSIGLMSASAEFVMFADDDIIWEQDHLMQMMDAMEGNNWAFCKRRIWKKINNNEYEYIGVDDFESVGEEAKTPYKMVDNNCLIFNRRFGVSSACLYRETKEYNDDRLMYDFLKKYAGPPGKTNNATVNQVCPKKLEAFFEKNCTK